MPISPLAGKPAPKSLLIDLAGLERDYYERRPDLADPAQLVSFGTSGHRGSPLRRLVHRGAHPGHHPGHLRVPARPGHRRPAVHGQGHARRLRRRPSAPPSRCWPPTASRRSIQRDDGVTPTPVISRAILVHNRGRQAHLADGIVITPSHNPPEDGGFKYNPPDGGPADTDVTRWIQDRANELLRAGNAGVKRVPLAAAMQAATTRQEDCVMPYVEDLRNVIDMEAIRAAGLKLGVDPLGGAAVHYWEPINAVYGLDIAVVNPTVDPTFAFMTVDHDGKIRMDCSSPYAMARLRRPQGRLPRRLRATTPTPTATASSRRRRLDEPEPLPGGRDPLPAHASPGLARAARRRQDAGQQQHDRPRGAASWAGGWAKCRSASSGSRPGLFDGSFCFGGEESAGASFLRRDGTVWTTDKDGPIMDLLAAEITARTGKDPGEHYPGARRRVRHAVLHAHRRRRRRPSRRRGWRSCRPRR